MRIMPFSAPEAGWRPFLVAYGFLATAEGERASFADWLLPAVGFGVFMEGLIPQFQVYGEHS